MPILARFAAQVVESGWRVTAHSKVEAAAAGLRRKGERVKADRVRSGCGELELAQGVEGALADLAGDGQSRHGRVASLAGGAIEGKVGGGWAVRVHCGFDQRPAQMR